MTEAKRLLEQATPLPWKVNAHEWEDGTTYSVSGPPSSRVLPVPVAADAANTSLIVYAVNRLPDYEAAVEALERLGERHHSLSDHNPGSVFEMRPAFEGLPECDDYTCVDARAALARLREGDAAHVR